MRDVALKARAQYTSIAALYALAYKLQLFRTIDKLITVLNTCFLDYRAKQRDFAKTKTNLQTLNQTGVFQVANLGSGAQLLFLPIK